MSSNPPRPEVLAFLEAVKADAEDDVPRLILADWLEERGDPRGEFLRVQCQLAAGEWGGPQDRALARRQRGLLAQYGETWTAPLAPFLLDRHFWRGLLRVNLKASGLLAAAAAGQGATEAWAWVEGLTLWELPGASVNALTACGLLAAAHSLSVRVDGAGYPGAFALGLSPHVTRLGELHLCRCGIGSEGLTRLARSPHLTGLRRLYLDGNHIADDGVQALAASPLLAQLTVLDLSGNRIGDRGVRALAESPHLSRQLHLLLERAATRSATRTALRNRLGARVVL
jgi:uncharacterized protein (TIGR02996 family)